MNNKTGARKIVYLLVGVLLGAIIVMPTQAHRISSRDAHTLNNRHAKSYALRGWVKKYFGTKGWVKKYFSTKRWVKKYSYPRSGVYTKKQSNGKYYTKGAVDTLIANYLTSSAAASTYLTKSSASGTYLTQSGAANTYLTQSNAASTYLSQSGASSAYVSKSGDTLTGDLTTSGDYKYSSAQTKYKTIPASSFVPQTNLVLTYTEGGNAYYKASGSDNLVMAGVDLPDGAEITALTNYSSDGNALSIDLNLSAAALGSSSVGSISTVASSGDGGTPGYSAEDNTISNQTVDNSMSYYFLSADLTNSAASLTFRGARITYTTTAVDDKN